MLTKSDFDSSVEADNSTSLNTSIRKLSVIGKGEDQILDKIKNLKNLQHLTLKNCIHIYAENFFDSFGECDLTFKNKLIELNLMGSYNISYQFILFVIK